MKQEDTQGEITKKIDPLQALQLLISHVEAQTLDRQKAKDIQGKFVPTDEQKAERDRLLRLVIASLNTTRAD